MTAYFRLMRLDKPIGIYLLLYPTLWALFLAAGGLPDLKLFVIFWVNFPCGDRTVLRAFNQFINLSIRIIVNHTAC
jgi:4-hydroxybenzoate polyprenyltransferase